MLPLVAALFWFLTYRRSMAIPPLWNVRAMSMQATAVAVFMPTVVGAAAWMGSREARHGLTDLLAGTARPRWARQLATWAATTGWALAAYLGCVGVLYGVDRAAGRLGWAAVVAGRGRRREPAGLSALGFAAGALRPSRFTPPLVAVAAFLALEISAAVHPRRPVVLADLAAGRRPLGPRRRPRGSRRSTPTCPTFPSPS